MKSIIILAIFIAGSVAGYGGRSPPTFFSAPPRTVSTPAIRVPFRQPSSGFSPRQRQYNSPSYGWSSRPTPTKSYGATPTYSAPQRPTQSYGGGGNSYSAPVQSYGGGSSYSSPAPSPAQSYSSPSGNSYSAPAQSYSSPSGNSYSAPAQSYSSSSGNSYSAPAQSYSSPSGNSYSAPVQSYGAGNGGSYSAPIQSYSGGSGTSYSSPSIPVQSYGGGSGSYSAPSTSLQPYSGGSGNSYSTPIESYGGTSSTYQNAAPISVSFTSPSNQGGYGGSGGSTYGSYGSGSANIIPITKFNHVIKPASGEYNIEFETGNGIHSQESGHLKTIQSSNTYSSGNYGQEGYGWSSEGQSSNVAHVKTGTTSWCSPEGIQYTLSYSADETGYHPTVNQGTCSSSTAYGSGNNNNDQAYSPPQTMSYGPPAQASY